MSAGAETDEDLMLRYRDGDAAAFDALYRRHRLPMYRFLAGHVRDRAMVEELFQDIWLSLVRAREGYQVRAKFRTFLYRVAHNRLVDHYRHRRRAAETFVEAAAGGDPEGHASDLPDAERIIDAQRRLQRLRAAVAALPPEQREAFLLHEEAGLSIGEIAETTGVGWETAKSRLRYAWSKLRAHAEEG